MKDRELKRYAYLDCRDMGHAWQRDGTVVDRTTRPLVYRRQLVCIRCATHRYDRISGSGDRRGSYDWPDDYKLENLTRDDRRQIRIVNVRKEFRSQ